MLPLRFHIVQDLLVKKGKVEMRSWVSEKDIEEFILPELNRIWRPAGISFLIEQVLQTDALNPEDKDGLLRYIADAHRNEEGKSDPLRIKKLNKLINWQQHSKKSINIYFVPYLGETSQGNAIASYKRVFLGQYTDKASGAKRPPKKFQLTEPLPFKEGSLSRTAAHEIGHILGLGHPNKKTQKVFNRLMGGNRQGYVLTPEEIKAARKRAGLWWLVGQ